MRKFSARYDAQTGGTTPRLVARRSCRSVGRVRPSGLSPWIGPRYGRERSKTSGSIRRIPAIRSTARGAPSPPTTGLGWIRARCLSYAQLRHALQVAKARLTQRDYTAVITLAETGARPSEALALQWTDVDLDRRRLHIERSVGPHGEIAPTKTKATRFVPVSGPLREALATWRQTLE